MNSELQDMLKESQRLLRDTVRATNRLSQLATAIVDNLDERLTPRAKRERGNRGNGHAPRRRRQK